MQYARAQNILSGQSNLARRVFAAVPMQEFWSVPQISAEMARLDNHNLTKGEITGCLRCLVDAGLVNETASLTFRSTVKPAKDTVVMEPKKNAGSAKVSLFDQLAAKAELLRSMADDVDQIALEMADAIQTASGDGAKLKALQATLRGLMGEG